MKILHAIAVALLLLGGNNAVAQGTYVSKILDAGQVSRFGTFLWQGEVPRGPARREHVVGRHRARILRERDVDVRRIGEHPLSGRDARDVRPDLAHDPGAVETGDHGRFGPVLRPVSCRTSLWTVIWRPNTAFACML